MQFRLSFNFIFLFPSASFLPLSNLTFLSQAELDSKSRLNVITKSESFNFPVRDRLKETSFITWATNDTWRT